MSEQNAVLFANEAFYLAFADRNIKVMESVWAENKSVSCIHPGWQTLLGLQEVMESWSSILSNPDSPDVTCRAQRAAIYGDMAIVTCVEEISSRDQEAEFLTATNVFVKAGSVWVMVHHHAGPVHLDSDFLEEEEDDTPQPIN